MVKIRGGKEEEEKVAPLHVGMHEVDHYADAETTFMLIRLKMNLGRIVCANLQRDLRLLFVCLLGKLLNSEVVTMDCIGIYLRFWINRWCCSSIES